MADTNGNAGEQGQTGSARSGAGLQAQDSAQSLAQPSNGDPLTAASAPGHDRHTLSNGDNGAAASSEDEILMGCQLLDLWMNLCLCHTLIVEDVEKGQPTVYQVGAVSLAQRMLCVAIHLPNRPDCSCMSASSYCAASM